MSLMRNKKLIITQTQAPITIMETTITKIELVKEDVDTITIVYSFSNKAKFKKEFKKYSFEYLNNFKNKKIGDSVRLKVSASIIRDIS